MTKIIATRSYKGTS